MLNQLKAKSTVLNQYNLYLFHVSVFQDVSYYIQIFQGTCRHACVTFIHLSIYLIHLSITSIYHIYVSYLSIKYIYQSYLYITSIYHIYVSFITSYHITSIYHIYWSYLSIQIIISYVSITSIHVVIIYVATWTCSHVCATWIHNSRSFKDISPIQLIYKVLINN